MKRYVLVLILFLLPFAALTEARAPSAFYFNASLGLGTEYQILDVSGGRVKDEPKRYEYIGFPSVSASMKMGIMLLGFWTIHAMVDFSESSGEYDGRTVNGKFKDISGDTRNYELGVGLSFYPFQYFMNSLNGTYISSTYLIGIQNNSCEGPARIHEMGAAYANLGLAFEIGKEFKITERLYLGAEFKYRFLGSISGSDTAGDDKDEIPNRTHASNIFAFAMTFTRR